MVVVVVVVVQVGHTIGPAVWVPRLTGMLIDGREHGLCSTLFPSISLSWSSYLDFAPEVRKRSGVDVWKWRG